MPQQPAAAIAPAEGQPARRSRGLALSTRLLYSVGELGNTLKTYAFGLFLIFFYNSVLGVPGTLVGLATAVGLVWDAVIDPFIGQLSDRAQTRFGRRHLFMTIGAICMGVSFIAIFTPPAGLSTELLVVWLFVTSLLLRTSNSLFIVPYHALGAELSADYSERAVVTGTRAAFALGGTLLAAGMSFALFFPQRADGLDPKFNPEGYLTMALTFGLIMTAVGLIATFATRGVEQPAAAPRRTFVSMLEALRNRSFLILAVSVAIFFLASVINATLAINFLTHYARLTTSGAMSLFQLAFYIGALAGVGIWAAAARRIDKHHLYIGATLATAGVMVAAYLLVGEGRLFGLGNLPALAGGNLLAGFFASALWAIPASMVADIVDQDELSSGMRREGLFFGVFSFAQQMAASLAVLATGFLLDTFAGLLPGQAEQSPLTMDRIGLLFGPLPAVLLVLAALLMLGYRLDRAQVALVQRSAAQHRTTDHS